MTLFVETPDLRNKVGQFKVQQHSAPEVQVTAASTIPAEATMWQDGDTSFRTGADYNGWVSAEDVADRTDDRIRESVDAGDLDSGVEYSVESDESGTYGAQSVTVTVGVPASRVDEFAEKDELTDSATDLKDKLLRIADSWSFSKSAPWAAPEHMYQSAVRFRILEG